MTVLSNLRNEAGAVNQHCTMGADTISKNGRSSKSQMSRENRKLFILFILIVSTFVFSSCSSSSPEKDGKKAAIELCKCEQELVDDFLKEFSNFERKFSSYGFKTRTEAKEKSMEIVNSIREKYEICRQNAEGNRQKMLETHFTP